MTRKKVLITQSNYIPWKGYFDAIQLVDEVILYDDMQYTKRDWRNRNQIKTANGLHWLTIPVQVKGKYFQKINETTVNDKKWTQNHWKTIKMNYAKAKYFDVHKDFFEHLYLSCQETYLSKINYHFIQGINQFLNINTPITFSSEFDLAEGRTERLIDLCKRVGGTDYYTGPAAKNYMQESMFADENITLHYLDYSDYREYSQLYPPFTHYVSVLDLIFNCGKNAPYFMKYFDA